VNDGVGPISAESAGLSKRRTEARSSIARAIAARSNGDFFLSAMSLQSATAAATSDEPFGAFASTRLNPAPSPNSV
jgi:hypothetical protein